MQSTLGGGPFYNLIFLPSLPLSTPKKSRNDVLHGFHCGIITPSPAQTPEVYAALIYSVY